MKMKITLIKSPSGAIPKHRRAVRTLGLYKLHQSVEKEFTPAIKGAVNNISYLLKVQEVK